MEEKQRSQPDSKTYQLSTIVSPDSNNSANLSDIENNTTNGHSLKKTDNYVAYKNRGWRRYLNKGDISNLASFIIMVIAILIKIFASSSMNSAEKLTVEYFLAFGLFGFAGGITNWLAIEMLFEEVPLLYGSGVIPKQFISIREAVKVAIMKSFFDTDYLNRYLTDRSKQFLKNFDLSSKLTSMIAGGNDFDAALTVKLEQLGAKPEGMMLQTIAQMFGGYARVTPLVKPMIVSFAQDFGAKLSTNFDISDYVSPLAIQQEIDRLMTEKLQLLTADKVKELMEEVIRDHLGWLIVWGNVFGGVIGIVSLAAGYGS